MILYLDTSSLLKIYIEEEGSPAVRALVAQTRRRGTSLIAYAEARSGFARARASNRLTGSAYATALHTFERNWAEIDVVAVSVSLVRAAGGLADRHGLRGFDAIHLASAIDLQEKVGEPVTFAAFDRPLLRAAGHEGLTQVSV